MESNISYKGEEFELCEEFTDVGYMAENIEVKTLDNEVFQVKRSHSDGSMTLLVSFPNLDDSFKQELLRLDEFMSNIQVSIFCYFIFDKNSKNLQTLAKELNKFKILIDEDEEFGNMYGTKIVSGSLDEKLTKALFLISKDGAVFYLNMPNKLENSFDIQRLQVELNKAYITYNGQGCHG